MLNTLKALAMAKSFIREEAAAFFKAQDEATNPAIHHLSAGSIG